MILSWRIKANNNPSSENYPNFPAYQLVPRCLLGRPHQTTSQITNFLQLSVSLMCGMREFCDITTIMSAIYIIQFLVLLLSYTPEVTKLILEICLVLVSSGQCVDNVDEVSDIVILKI